MKLQAGSYLKELNSIDSTNTYLLNLIKKNAALPGMGVFTTTQTRGKGQRGHKWLGEPGKNLAISFAVPVKGIPLSRQFLFSAAVAGALCKYLTAVTGSKNNNVKWPNDIYYGHKKLAGILIESIIGPGKNSPGTSWQWAVIGIGINVNQTSFDAEVPNAISLQQITGQPHDIKMLAQQLVAYLQHSLQLFDNEQDERVLGRYNRHLYRQNEQVNFKTAEGDFTAVIKEVLLNGQLAVSTVTGDRNLTHGVQEWVV